jgi:hypothetical protein
MRTTWAADTGLTDARIGALIREARRRQRVRYLVSGLICVSMIAAGAAIYASAHSTQRLPRPVASHLPVRVSPGPAIPARIPAIGTKVMLWPLGEPLGIGNYAGPPFVIADLRTGHYVQTGKVDLCCGDYQPLMVRVGRWLVYAGNGATAIRTDLTGHPRVLGATSLFAPAATAGDVWLEYPHPAGTVIRLVPVAGGQPGPPVTLPRGSELVAGTDGGLLLQNRNGGLWLWSPGSAPRTLPGSPMSGDGFAVTPSLVAYGTACRYAATSAHAAFRPDVGYPVCAMLRVLAVHTGQVTTFASPAGTTGWVPPEFDAESPVSPTGAMIAAEAAVPSRDRNRGRLYVLSLSGTRRPPVAVSSSAGYLFSKTAWSSDGSWVFYQGPGGRLWAFRIATRTVRSSSVPCCLYTVMVSVPAPLPGTGYRS